MAAVGIMSVKYQPYKLNAAGNYFPENNYRRYLSVFSDADTIVTFVTDPENPSSSAKNPLSMIIPAGMPWSPLVTPTNGLFIKSAGVGLVLEG